MRACTLACLIVGAATPLSCAWTTSGPKTAVSPESTALPTTRGSSCTVVQECEFACREGRAESCQQLAHMYETGQGAPQNVPRAADLYAEACHGGQVDACSHLAMMHDIGLGVPRDLGKAALLYDRACAQGDRWSCTRRLELTPH